MRSKDMISLLKKLRAYAKLHGMEIVSVSEFLNVAVLQYTSSGKRVKINLNNFNKGD